LFNPIYALIPALIWALSPIFYRGFMKRFDFLVLNFLRTAIASMVMVVPAFLIGGTNGVSYALLSGAITLACGDTFYLLAVREMGASIAAPIVYVYVLLVQFTAITVGESVPFSNYLAAVMVILGIYVLSRGGGGEPRAKGIAYGLLAGVIWTVGQTLIRLATNTGGNVLVLATSRNVAAAGALLLAVVITRRGRLWPTGVTLKEIGVIGIVAVSDLGLGSLAYIYSVSLIGIALTVVITSVSPLLTQIFSKLLGKESPTATDFAGGALIVSALVLAVLL
jgi:drug/metabolite transporter, DME family